VCRPVRAFAVRVLGEKVGRDRVALCLGQAVEVEVEGKLFAS
jgi:hypothetical protein